jgi:metal-responsive CopG/Arc/MetJ family transcriptional regulator
MRTIIELPDAQVEALDALCRHEGISRAEAIRRAVAAHVKAERARGGDPAFGVWRARRLSGLEYQRRARREWDHR